MLKFVGDNLVNMWRCVLVDVYCERWYLYIWWSL